MFTNHAAFRLDPFDPEVHHDLESNDQDRPVMGEQNERLNICSDALGDVIDAPSTGLSLTGRVPTEPATFHPALQPSSNVQTDSINIIGHPICAKKTQV